MKQILPKIAERLMCCPAAPYHEHLVAAEAIRICEENGLVWEADSFGNLLVRCDKKIVQNPIALAAHMDHPGFVLRLRIDDRTVIGRFLGGVGDSYFRAGTRLMLMPGRVRAALGKRVSKKERDFEIKAGRDLPEAPKFAVWDLPEFQSRAGFLRGRVCDDLIGVATILAVLISLKGSAAGRNVLGVLSRAEEVGFQGALALASSRRLPAASLIISLETSRELPSVKMGAGVILRVGDRASIFDSEATRFLAEVATELGRKEKSFCFQRALMSGGTCEATAYQEYGYRCAAVCVALGNYHNCGARNKIRAEYVSESDALSMGRLLAECARAWPKFDQLVSRLPKRLAKLEKEGRRELRKNPCIQKSAWKSSGSFTGKHSERVTRIGPPAS
jgi:putative aminopeptidase FrvX